MPRAPSLAARPTRADGNFTLAADDPAGLVLAR
jgi:hypothetical protein